MMRAAILRGTPEDIHSAGLDVALIRQTQNALASGQFTDSLPYDTAPLLLCDVVKYGSGLLSR